ncbi:hypothetical protein GGQ88_001402 [Novosphingobium hassiacum]|uniref:Uncharacterized protein n=1 Tax=Novosphingobium hassiacum TaxID=173676 RepID=A0A7W5ZVA9_9SPHN|nr:hypothetical protein [Novosphingobium hassiacum]MBB3860141.1 hypothetical protein [Novosphingobium hassiacum]
MTDSAEAADRLSLRRVRALQVVMILFAAQAGRPQVDMPDRAVEYVGHFAWLVMALVLFMVLRTGGFWLRNPELRALANDEVTRAHRAEAMEWGFTAAILVAIGGCVVASLTAMPSVFAFKLVILIGLFVAVFRFVKLERAALA